MKQVEKIKVEWLVNKGIVWAKFDRYVRGLRGRRGVSMRRKVLKEVYMQTGILPQEIMFVEVLPGKKMGEFELTISRRQPFNPVLQG